MIRFLILQAYTAIILGFVTYTLLRSILGSKKCPHCGHNRVRKFCAWCGQDERGKRAIKPKIRIPGNRNKYPEQIVPEALIVKLHHTCVSCGINVMIGYDLDDMRISWREFFENWDIANKRIQEHREKIQT